MKDNERMLVSAYVDGEVEAPWTDQIARRIAEDPEWAAEAERHHKVKAALARLAEPDWSSQADRIQVRVGNVTRPDRRLSVLALTWGSVAAAAVLVLAVGGGYWLGRQSSAPGPQVSELQVQVPKQIELQLSGEGQLIMASTLQGTGR